MRSSKVCHSVFVAGFLLVVSARGWAIPITYLTDQRSISASAGWCEDYPDCIGDRATDAPAPGAFVFDSSVHADAGGFSAASSQNSTLANTFMSGRGSLSAGGGIFDGSSSAMSLFLVGFRLDEASPFDLSATLSTGLGGWEAIVDLRVADGGSIYYYREYTPYEDVLIHESGVLPPGDYRLEVRGTGSHPGYGEGGWNFDFTVVPEPHAALLLGLGLTSVALYRRAAGRWDGPPRGGCGSRP